MLTIIVLALIAAAGYVVYRYLQSGAEALKADVGQDVQAVEAAVQTDAKVAEAATANAVADIKAKL